ncbi:eco [Drosophila busckii]|uniref:Eco n=2 Tax=Drosophila busckii TaxID=30019 RepID=A0A0M5J3Q3_DROBS|nr:eco [Drosophila busckii]
MMETPTGPSTRPSRVATPRLSERKKQLFRSRSSMLDQIDDDNMDPLLGIEPLRPKSQVTENSDKLNKIRNLFDVAGNAGAHRFRLRSSTSSSPETNKENKGLMRGGTRGGGAMAVSDEQLPHLFTTTMRINSNSSTSQTSSPRTPRRKNDSVINISSDSNSADDVQQRSAVKRAHKPTSVSDSSPGSPQSKQRRKLEECIPTGLFYSHASTSQATKHLSSVVARQTKKPRKFRVVSPPSRPRLGVGRGVKHKIRKPQRPMTGTAVDLDDIMGSLRNEKLLRLITTKREERAKAEEVHKILRSAKDPIKMAKPLSVMAGDDANNNNTNADTTMGFSDFSDEEQLNESIPVEPVIPLIRYENTASTDNTTNTDSKRKFFKSGNRSSTSMEVRITDNIRASVNHGKISLVEAPVRKPRKLRVKSSTIFSAEQATVDAILRNLDDTVIDEIIEAEPTPTPVQLEVATIADPYAAYRQRLPYNTDDLTTIEQQNVLLEFLISNNICTDENFEIFIGDPENHRYEAERIVDELFMAINVQEMEQQLPATQAELPIAQHELSTVPSEVSTDPAVMPAAMQSVPSICESQQKMFPIFTRRLQPIQLPPSRRKLSSSTRLTSAASGAGQLQIDAGQKAFGAKQCHQCGLVYTVHEPEEEQLHLEYHESIHVLRFKGWIDEDIVAVCPDWAPDGRIIRITERAPAARLQRLKELVIVVDKELGYSSYIVPSTFVAYFAVRKQQIVGLCLVQPLAQAYRFIQVDGTDYFSEETFEASCGVSRIWVTPLQRRRGIATKLLRVVQSQTILGSDIPRDRIAFSTPTDAGRALAQHFTQQENFLSYDQ